MLIVYTEAAAPTKMNLFERKSEWEEFSKMIILAI